MPNVLTTITPWSNESVGIIFSTTLASAVYPTANLALYFPFAISQSCIAVDMFCYNGAAVAGNVDMGIYTAGGTLLVSTGATAQASTNVLQKIAITDTTLVGPNDFYMGISLSDATTATLFRVATAAQTQGSQGGLQEASAHPLPATATFAACATAYTPFFGLTINTTL